jgi:predicted ATPase/DNA-binding CsgD family transcriptional regulator/DNA-binding transcriptional regulator YiaG/Tfp pilus assembly protein PilF
MRSAEAHESVSSANVRDEVGDGGATRVRALRMRLRLSQEQLATQLGVSFVTVNRWENGRASLSAMAQRRLDQLEQKAAAPQQPPRAMPPVPVSSFVGREPEIAALTSLLSASRLVSLVGPGGSGKTRLALEVLRRRRGDAAAVTFVALNLISDAAPVDTWVAAALGLRDEPGAPAVAAIGSSLRSRPTLLVLDGAEHVLGGVADLVDRVLAEAPETRIVVTSRCVLEVPGEQVWPVPALTCPAPDATAAQAATCDAVRLFAIRAAERMPRFEITPELAQPVAELCRRLDGLPLAIELAASWVGTLSISQILDHRFDLMDPAPPGGDRRVRTLRAVAESSNALLGVDERGVLQALSVFTGWFSLPDIAAVTDIPADRLVHPLRRLVNSSWLIARHDGDQSVYRMLATLREYASGQLEAAGGTQLARARHAGHFAALARLSEQALAGPERATWITRMEVATADLEAALTWAQAAGETSMGLEMSAALWRWWLTTGRLAEGRRWLAAFISRAPKSGDDAAVAQAWWAAAVLATENGDYRSAIEQASRALRAFGSLGTVDSAAKAATVLGAAYRYLGDHAEACRHLEVAVAHRRRLGDEAGTAAALNNIAVTVMDVGDYGRAQRLLEEALTLKRKLGDVRSVAVGLTNLADVFLKTGQADRAAAALAQAADLAADLGDRQLAGAIACNQGDLARTRSDFPGAARHYRRSLECYRTGGNVHDTILALCGLGVTLHHLGEAGQAASLLREAETLAISVGNGNRMPEVRAALAAAGQPALSRPPGELTSRQAEILAHVAAGMTSKDIAALLGISSATVDRHLATIYRKLGLSNRAQATRYALRHGLLR